MAHGEAAVDFGVVFVFGGEVFVEFVFGIDVFGVFLTQVQSFLEHAILDLCEQVGGGVGELVGGNGGAFFGGLVAAAHEDAVSFEFSLADFEADGYAFFDPGPDLVTAAAGAGIDMHAEVLIETGLLFEALSEFFAEFDDLGSVFFFVDEGEDDDLGGCQARGQDESVVVAVGHEQSADQPGGDAPGGGPGVRFLTVLVLEFDFGSFGEVLAEEVAGAGLESFAVLHHAFDAEGGDGAGEAFGIGFFAFDDGHGHEFFSEFGVDVEHLSGFDPGFFAGGVDGVAFLPEEFGGAEEQSGAHFPADDVGPLVDEQGQVAVGLDPFGEHGPDDGFGGGADDEGFFEFTGGDEFAFGVDFQAVVGDDGAFFGETFDVLGFFFEKAYGDEQGEIGVLMSGVFEHFIEAALDVLPQAVAPGLDDHAAANG